MGIGIGLGVSLTLVMMVCILFFLCTRSRREIPTRSIAVKLNDDHAQISELENVNVVAHGEIKLPASRSPVLEMPG